MNSLIIIVCIEIQERKKQIRKIPSQTVAFCLLFFWYFICFLFFRCIKLLLGRRTKTPNHFKCVKNKNKSFIELCSVLLYHDYRTQIHTHIYSIQRNIQREMFLVVTQLAHKIWNSRSMVIQVPHILFRALFRMRSLCLCHLHVKHHVIDGKS